MRRIRSVLVAAAIALVAASAPAAPLAAAEYPTKPIKLVVPFQAGSSVDVIARALTQGLATELGEPVVIDNRPGAGAIIGTAYVARAEPDGYTMLLATGPHTSQPSVAKDLPYDPIRDFAPITQIAASCGLVMLTNMHVKAHSVADIVALAKADPGKVTYATLGFGSSTHVAGALFAKLAGVDMTAVPYATPNLLSDLISGQIDTAFVSTISSVELIEGRKVRPLASTGPKRCTALPDVPTLRELGYREFDREGYFGIAFPAAVPPAIVDRIYQATVEVLKTPAMKAALDSVGLTGIGSTPAAFTAFLKEDLEKQAYLVRFTGIKAP